MGDNCFRVEPHVAECASLNTRASVAYCCPVLFTTFRAQSPCCSCLTAFERLKQRKQQCFRTRRERHDDFSSVIQRVFPVNCVDRAVPAEGGECGESGLNQYFSKISATSS